MRRECLNVIKSLRLNSSIVITKPDEGSSVVILNKTDYIAKMNCILEDQAKFLALGPSSKNNNSSKIEPRIQRRPLQLHIDDLLPTNLYEFIQPTGSQQPRMYGLPKTQKKDVPLRPILSIYDRFSATPAGQISIFCSRTGSHSIGATAYGTLLTLAETNKLQIWTLPPSFSARLTFRVYLLMCL